MIVYYSLYSIAISKISQNIIVRKILSNYASDVYKNFLSNSGFTLESNKTRLP